MNDENTHPLGGNRQRRRRDTGSVLPMALVMTVVLSVVVIGLANYTMANIGLGQVVENRADRLSAAEAGLRHVLEQEQEANSLCTTAAGTGDGTTFTLPDTISGATVEVNCKQVGTNLAAITAWAVVITGEGGVPAGEGLVTEGSGSDKNPKTFGGPSYVANKGLLGIDKPLKVEEGNMWFTDPSCDAGGQYDSGSTGKLLFSPASRGLWCTSKVWSELFPKPWITPVPTSAPNPPFVDIGPCRVFEPGYYTAPPVFGNKQSVYMKSGDYLFYETGPIVLDKATVTFGREGVAGGQQEIDNPDCTSQREADIPGGATVYLGGNSRFKVEKGSIEILRREQDDPADPTDPVNYVSIHTLSEGPMASTLDYRDNVISTDSGNKKEMVLQGLVWAPNAAIQFGNVTNTASAHLSGGAVVAKIVVKASGSADALKIQVQGSDQSTKLQYTATATKSGTTRVRVVAQVQFAPPKDGAGPGRWELATNSWRVCRSAC